MKTINIFFALSIILLASTAKSYGEVIENEQAVLVALNKITAKIETLTISVGKPVKYEALIITVYKCLNRTEDEPQKITALIEIYDTGPARNDYKHVFSGWHFAESPSINPFEHAVYGVWLKDCKSSQKNEQTFNQDDQSN